ncbi:MAG: thioredoxin family protein [Bacteroidia bacterium]
MNKLKKTFVFLFFIISSVCLSQTDTSKKENTLQWYTDIMKAHEISLATNKPIFALFTGSDWCFWCKKLQANVLSKPEFVEWAKKNVVLVELDFPRGKALSPELVQQNNSLQQTFGVQGYPTIWMFSLNKDAATSKFNIDALGSLGYPQNPEPGKEQIKFLNDANGLLAKKTVK